MVTHKPALPLSFACLLACLTGCGASGDPPEAVPFSHPLLVEANALDGEPPDDATFMSPEAMASYLDSREAVLVQPNRAQDELERARTEDIDIRARFRQEFVNDPESLAWLDQEVPPNDEDLRQLADGTLSYRGIRGDAQAGQSERFFALTGVGVGLAEALEARRDFELPETQHGIYAQMYPMLPTEYVVGEQLPHPSDVEQAAFATLRDLNRRVARDWDRFVGTPDPLAWPDGYPVSWRDEEGVDWRSDRDQPLDLYPTGIWQDAAFPLKWCATHVRDQGSRATDRAFAITAAIEARFAALRSRWLNLSEQMLYNQAQGFWRANDFESSLTMDVFLSEMSRGGFTYPLEASWDYNRSLLREVLPLRYVKSCWVDAAATLYGGEFCSDTAHQSPIVYTRLDSRVFCAKRDPDGLVAEDSHVKLRLGGYREIYGSRMSHIGPDGHREDPMLLAKGMLAIKVPVTLLFWVPATFAEATANRGVVPFDASEPRLAATHALVLLGYVPNASLEPGIPPAAGGGYFIAKNSFGTAWGDAGYCYLAEDWVHRHVYSMHAIIGVTD